VFELAARARPTDQEPLEERGAADATTADRLDVLPVLVRLGLLALLPDVHSRKLLPRSGRSCVFRTSVDRRPGSVGRSQWPRPSVEGVRVEKYGDVLEARRRRSLAKSLQGVVNSLDPNRLPGASPLNRRGLWLYVPEIRTLAARVGDLDQPVTRRGLE